MIEEREAKELEAQVAKLIRENQTLEQNINFVVGPYGSITKELKSLRNRITALEVELAKTKANPCKNGKQKESSS